MSPSSPASPPLSRPEVRESKAGHWKNPRLLGRIPQIDGLRGLAILVVVLFHYVTAIGAPRHQLWGLLTASTRLFWSGVDLFFVLSGFLISGILIDSVQSSHYFKTFYLRRFHRIFPLYFGWLALFCLGIYFHVDARLGRPVFEGQVPLWMYPVFLQNNAPLWFNATAPLWMAMSWSLAVEEQFYAILPGIVRLAGKTALAGLAGATIFLSPVYRTLLVAGHPQLNSGWTFATASRLDGLAMGAIVALLARNESCWAWLGSHRRGLQLCGTMLLLGFVALTYGSPSDVSMASFGFTAIAAMYAVLLLLAISQPDSLLSRRLKAPFLRYFGRISYAIYIFHQGIHEIVDALVPRWTPRLNSLRTATVVSLSLLVTIALSELSWRFMESKLIKRAHVQYAY